MKCFCDEALCHICSHRSLCPSSDDQHLRNLYTAKSKTCCVCFGRERERESLLFGSDEWCHAIATTMFPSVLFYECWWLLHQSVITAWFHNNRNSWCVHQQRYPSISDLNIAKRQNDMRWLQGNTLGTLWSSQFACMPCGVQFGLCNIAQLL